MQKDENFKKDKIQTLIHYHYQLALKAKKTFWIERPLNLALEDCLMSSCVN